MIWLFFVLFFYTIRKVIVKMLTNKIFNYQSCQNMLNSFFPQIFRKKTFYFLTFETTGLSHRNSRVYLIGAALCAEGKWEMIQFLAQEESEEEERAVLEAFQSLCAQKRCFVHFNGSTFDIPYLQHKYQSCSLQRPSQTLSPLTCTGYFSHSARFCRPPISARNPWTSGRIQKTGYHGRQRTDKSLPDLCQNRPGTSLSSCFFTTTMMWRAWAVYWLSGLFWLFSEVNSGCILFWQ